jgi:hypothetical protein
MQRIWAIWLFGALSFGCSGEAQPANTASSPASSPGSSPAGLRSHTLGCDAGPW